MLEDLDTEGLIQKGVTRTRRMRLYDSSFSELRRCLEWVFQKQGKTVLAVSAYNTSRECFLCGGINKGLTLEDRVFHCPHYGFTLDRDLNASLVLLKRAGWEPPAVPEKLRPIPPLPSLGLKKRRQGGAMKQEAPPGGVAHTSSMSDIQKREIKSVVDASLLLKPGKVTIVTWDLEDEVKNNVKIRFVPLWKWLLGQSESR